MLIRLLRKAFKDNDNIINHHLLIKSVPTFATFEQVLVVVFGLATSVTELSLRYSHRSRTRIGEKVATVKKKKDTVFYVKF